MKKILFSLATMSALTTLSAQKIIYSENFNTEPTGNVLWSDNFDDKDISDWKSYDKDGDGYKWSPVQFIDDDENPVGTPVISSASFINNLGALTPDNWIISPQIDLTKVDGKATLKYGVYASDPDWNKENYAVYVSTTNDPSNEAAFKQVFTENDLPGTETVRSIDLTEFVGQKVYITFRHFNVTDMFRINIDNVSVEGKLKEDGGTTGDHLFHDSFEEYDDFTVGGITATNNKGKMGDWTLVDMDKSTTYGFNGVTFTNAGKQMAYINFNSTKTAPVLTPSAGSDWTARTGQKAMVSFAATKPKNNDWLISPNITLGASDNVLTFYAKAGDEVYGFEEFNVLVSTTDTEIASFTKIASEAIDNKIEFAEYKYDLSAYNGKKVHIAIQAVSNDQFGFIVDDFTVNGSKLATSDVNTKTVTNVYPNPVQDSFKIDFGTNINQAKVSLELYNMNGVKVKSFKNASSYDISTLPAGVYVLNINDGTTKIVKKIIKK